MKKDIILYVVRRAGKPVGVTALYANHKYIGDFVLTEDEIKALRVGSHFQGYKIKEIRRRP